VQEAIAMMRTEKTQQILQTCQQIKQNMSLGETIVRKKIDVGIIEELKRRRAEQRLTGE